MDNRGWNDASMSQGRPRLPAATRSRESLAHILPGGHRRTQPCGSVSGVSLQAVRPSVVWGARSLLLCHCRPRKLTPALTHLIYFFMFSNLLCLVKTEKKTCAVWITG